MVHSTAGILSHQIPFPTTIGTLRGKAKENHPHHSIHAYHPNHLHRLFVKFARVDFPLQFCLAVSELLCVCQSNPSFVGESMLFLMLVLIPPYVLANSCEIQTYWLNQSKVINPYIYIYK